MSPYLRHDPGRRENVLAAGVALGAAAAVGAVVFYFGRILIAREKVTRLEVAEGEDASGHAPERTSPRAVRR